MPGIVPRAASSNSYAPSFMTDLMCKGRGARGRRRPRAAHPDVRAGGWRVHRLASSHGHGRPDFTSVYTFLKPSSDQSPV